MYKTYAFKTKRFVSRRVDGNGLVSKDEYVITKGIFSQIIDWIIRVLALIGLGTIIYWLS